MRSKIFSKDDMYLFHEGTHYNSYKMLGAHLACEKGSNGVRFSLWAPNAKKICISGEFNGWNGVNQQMEKCTGSGLWSIFVPNIDVWDTYKYEIVTMQGELLKKADPYAFHSELRPSTASKVFDLKGYEWHDSKWQEKKREKIYEEPMNIYEVHLGSWKQKQNGDFFSYREMAEEMVNYISVMGYTHVEIMPIAEHPFDGSWGYQATGYYSVTSRYGTPHDFMYLVDKFHQNGIGVILDWVPGHFCKDDHGLRQFDGTPLFEYEDEIKAENKGWGTAHFDLGKKEVQSFLISNAIFWFDLFHIDGLRVDSVANMLYLDHTRGEGEWKPNEYGGNENLEAIEFIKKLNEVVFDFFPNALMIAEESTNWPQVSGPTYLGGLGFNFKWNMGWMNDILTYLEMEPVHRKWYHNLLTFPIMYAFSENYVLPMSHDEVVHGKKSLINKMPGDYWRKFANLRAFYAYMMAQPGKKLLFMGGEFGQFIEWKYYEQLDWFLFEFEEHRKLHLYVRELNLFYRQEVCFWERDCKETGFDWIDPNNYTDSTISFIRYNRNKTEFTIVIVNFTPEVRYEYRVGVPKLEEYIEVFNSDSKKFGGSGVCNEGVIFASEKKWNNKPYSVLIAVPPLATIYIKLR
ncbi:MAG: 1,4-alpha-glucan branching enzyme [Alkaliphilus sp.]|nr:1,4-alpha-glucan branching protein GlgB [bacterium AH-315-L21]MBN4056558.1 1,4-alpha-glucan branching protein GlgB [bacterium AH-315-K05]MBN4069649.1 1,4-alpha-glucan branching protein GlgB [bacterium AH-315-G05]MBN4074307.1 1,4-alpha-glucan branching protein GlgB [bacterium AH-315-E09]PHS31784.1 MAG: 1,4-alpha-glucan branching enzyme [Alkaliphilus sp.]